MDAFDLIELDSPEVKPKFQKNKGKGDAFDHVEDEGETFWMNAARTALQIPQGYLETTKAGIAGGLWQLLGQGEVEDPEELDRIREISEREGIPFDEEAYKEAGNRALGTLPTVRNIASKIEEKTGIPLEPKTRVQKGLRFFTEATRLSPGKSSHLKGQQYPGTFKGMTAELPRPVLGAGVEAAKEIMQEAGVPEQWAELASFAILKQAPEGGGKLSFGKEKPSGLPERYFENIKEKHEVSPRKITQINDKLESDFKTISDRIIKESPVGETAENLRNDPTFKQQSRELLNEAQEIADTIPDKISSKSVKKEMADLGASKTKGFALSEFDKSYLKFMKEAIEDIIPKNVSAGELVEQYRKNNASLSEYFEPGSSKALNRAKKQALLDQNRAIAAVIEKTNPELSTVFKDGNARWTKIMDAEAVDGFVNEIFKEGVNYKKMHDFFDKNGYDFTFKRALGEQGFKDFEQLTKDMLNTEAPYKMLKVGQQKGFFQKFTEGSLAFMIHPWAGKAKVGYDIIKSAYKTAINSILDKPKLGLTWKRAIDELKKGDFAAAEKSFEEVKTATAEGMPKEEIEYKPKPEGETIQAKAEKIETKNQKVSGFKTEKGSAYTVNEDGSTTRDKAYRPEHGKEEQGLQPKSDKTWFVSKEDADKLGEFQTRGEGKRLIEFPDGRLGIMYDTGKDAGKVEARTVVTPQLEPKEGLIPVESWEGGKKVHFGNKITEIEKPPELPTTPTKTKAAPVEKEAKPKKLTKEEEEHLFGGKERIKKTKAKKEKVVESKKKKTESLKTELSKEKPSQVEVAEAKVTGAIDERPILKELLDLKEKRKTLKGNTVEIRDQKLDIDRKIKNLAKKLQEAKKHNVRFKSADKKFGKPDITTKGLKKQRDFIVEKVDKAIENPPESNQIHIDVPGDGEFYVNNEPRVLKSFKEKIMKGWPTKSLPNLKR